MHRAKLLTQTCTQLEFVIDFMNWGKGSIILVCYCGSNVRMNGHFVAIFTIPTGTDLETLNGNLLDGRNGPNM